MLSKLSDFIDCLELLLLCLLSILLHIPELIHDSIHNYREFRARNKQTRQQLKEHHLDLLYHYHHDRWLKLPKRLRR